MSDITALLNPHFTATQRTDYKTLEQLIDDGYLMLGWADPFFPDPSLPPHVLDATLSALTHGGDHYTLPIGTPTLRRAIADKLATRNRMVVDPDRELVVTPGSDTGLWQAMQVVLSPGDEVLTPEPSYPSNLRNAQLMGATPVSIPLDPAQGFQLDLDALRSRITPRTRLLLLTHPNNPTGTVYSRETLEGLAELIRSRNLLAVVDQAFEDMIYDDRAFTTFATLPGMRERTITVFSLSKGMALSGFRVGYTVAPPPIMEILHSTAVNILGATNTAAQAGAVAALRDPAFMAGYRRIFERRRIRAGQILAAIPGVKYHPPQAGLMIWLDISALGTGREVANHLLQDARILVHPGENFGGIGHRYIRIMLSALRDDDVFEEHLHQLAASLRRMKARAL